LLTFLSEQTQTVNMDIEADRNIKDKNKRKFKKSSRIIENLDEITLKSSEEYIVDDDAHLYFRRVSSYIEKEGIEGLLMDKFKYKNDSLELLVNRDDVYYDFEKNRKELINDMEKSVDIKSLCEILAGLDIYNSNIISGFKFTNNKLSKSIEKDRFNKSSSLVYSHDEQLIQQNDSILNLDNYDMDVDIDIHQPLDVNDSCLSPSMPPSPRDGLRTIAEMTQLLQQSEYSYFDSGELKIQDLRQSAKIKSPNKQDKVKIKRKKEIPRFEALIENDRSKFIKFTKVTQKKLFVSDRMIESRSKKCFNLENKHEFDHKTYQFFEMNHRKENARLFSEDADLFDIETNDNLETDSIDHDELPERSEMRYDDNEHVDLIPSNGQASLSKKSVNELTINTQIDNDVSLDGYDLIEELEKIKSFDIQYAKKFKYIDTKKLKDDIWNLICLNSNDGLNVIFIFRYIHLFNFCVLLG
jgi:hypothetical protein